MWPFRKKTKSKLNVLHGHDLDVWDYLGWTEIRFDGVPNSIHFFWKKGKEDVRSYVLTGRPSSVLKAIKELHRYVSDTCELWRIRENEIYIPIRNPSNFLKEYMMDHFSGVWSTERNWWVSASDQDKYDHSVRSHQKKHPDIYTDDNIVTVDFKSKN